MDNVVVDLSPLRGGATSEAALALAPPPPARQYWQSAHLHHAQCELALDELQKGAHARYEKSPVRPDLQGKRIGAGLPSPGGAEASWRLELSSALQ